ncbi:MAG: universal stress protein [Euryarchaeota archaeon]|nr:universal stress protein [Euryarchaeota archaeon]
MENVKRIIVPTDGSGHADIAVERGLSLAKALKKPVVVLYVVDRPGFQAFPPESLLVDVSDLVRKEASAVLAKIEARAKTIGVDVKSEVHEGHPAEEICRTAQPDDLIVIATHGRRGLSRMLLGSVAESVIRHAPCPVLVIRHGKT